MIFGNLQVNRPSRESASWGPVGAATAPSKANKTRALAHVAKRGWTWHDTFGQITDETNPAVDHLFGYTGRETDEESDLYYYRARYYDPTTGQFISEDPIGFEAGDANTRRYVGNSPTNATDPSGLAGYFFDGTGNDMDEFNPDGTPKDPELDSAPTHVAALFWMYTEDKFYEYGVGTRTEEFLGNLHGKGARERLDRMFERFEKTYDDGNGDTDIDIFGFSRGAAMAREFANMIHDKYPEARIRCLGIFDTVAQVGAPDRAIAHSGETRLARQGVGE